MYDQVVVRAQIRDREFERKRASMRTPTSTHRARFWKSSIGTAMSLSAAFAAGWLIASIF